MSSPAIVKRQSWKALESHHQKISKRHLRELFAEDPQRGERMALEAVGLYFDYSKNRITDETLKLILRMAEESGLPSRMEAMFSGEKINLTENRAVLHTALRAPRDASIVVDGENVGPKIYAVLDKRAHFADRVRNGDWKGYSQCRQHRHWWLRSWTSHGLRGPSLVYRSVYDISVCFQRRRNRLR